jgi:hypothetical protein
MTWWLLGEHTRGAEIAGVLGLPVALVAAVAAAGAAWPLMQPKATDYAESVAAARDLARLILHREASELELLLGDTGDPRPADIPFAQPELVSWRTDGGQRRGSLNNIATFYSSLDRGRLVVLGPPGSGKTILAVQLIHDLLNAPALPDPLRQSPVRVPIRLSASAFDPGQTAGDGAQIARRLDAWLARQLVDGYGIRPVLAVRFVADGWIIPVFDGLDEMDPDGETPELAAALIRGLNHYGGRRPTVVTCRSNRYETLVRQVIGGQPGMLQDATVIEIEPLNVSAVARYLSYRFPDNADETRVQQRWRPVVEHIKGERTGPLAIALCSPLRLFLAITAYKAPDTRPTEMTSMSLETLEHHLLDEFIPAVYRAHAGPDARRTSQAARSWLGFLANHLKHTVGSPDLGWWQLQQALPPRTRGLLNGLIAGLLSGVATGVAVGVAAGVAAGIGAGLSAGAGAGAAVGIAFAGWKLPESPGAAWWQPSIGGVTAALAAGLGTGIAVGLAFGMNSWISSGLAAGVAAGLGPALAAAPAAALAIGIASTRWKLPEPSHGLRWHLSVSAAVAGPAAGLGVGLAVGLSYGLTSGLAYGLGSGLAAGLAVGLAAGLEFRPPADRTATSPRSVLQRDRRTALILGITTGLGVGLVFALGFPLAIGFGVGLASGLAFGPVVSILKTASPSYSLTVAWLALHGRLPLHLMSFLADAHKRGVLRQVGASYQFRHIELRDSLADHR